MFKFKKLIFTLLITTTFILLLGTTTQAEEQTLYVFNWGEYIGEDVVSAFEAENPGVTVVYETFESNEAMYQKLKTNSSNYDVIIPSDYMIEKLISEDLLTKLDTTKIPNLSNIDQKYLEKSKVFDPNNEYSVPYFWGTVGILYDTTKVTKTVDSWSILWDEDYKDQIFMYDSQRDSLMVALKSLGYSMNTQDKSELNEAKELLIEQSKLVYSYVTDSVIDRMINGEAALAVVYSGDAAYIMDENPDMAYAIPKEGTNFWIDSMVIPKTSQNVDLAHKFINFMCSDTIALENTEYVMYSSPVTTVFDQVKTDEWANNSAYNPDHVIDVFGGSIETEVFRDPGDFITEYDKVWQEVLTSSKETNYLIPIIIGVVVIGIVTYVIINNKRKKID